MGSRPWDDVTVAEWLASALATALGPGAVHVELPTTAGEPTQVIVKLSPPDAERLARMLTKLGPLPQPQPDT